MIHDHAPMIPYEKCDQQLREHIFKFTLLQIEYPATCFGHLLWPSSGTGSLEDIL